MASGVLHSDCSYTHNKGIICEINEIKGIRCMQNVCVCVCVCARARAYSNWKTHLRWCCNIIEITW